MCEAIDTITKNFSRQILKYGVYLGAQTLATAILGKKGRSGVFHYLPLIVSRYL